MSRIRLTLLVEDLAALAAAAERAPCPALERFLARGRPLVEAAPDPDALRLRLFGADGSVAPPVAALTAVADGLADAGDRRFWLRLDPVTFSADLTRVFLVAHGLEDVDDADRAALRECVEQTLADAGFALECGRPEHWLVAMPGDPACRFTRLDDALGRDLAEVLPGAGEGREWRRLLTEIQVALHNAEVNRRRRAEGRREINGAWIWGEGRVPGATPSNRFDRVLSDHPVSRGLARLSGAPVEAADDVGLLERIDPGSRVLLDWTTGRAGASRELERVERLAADLSAPVRRGRLELTLLDGSGAGWRIDSGALRRFWRRPRPLCEALGASNGASR